MINQVKILEEIKQKINPQLKDEINNFKNKKENDLLTISKKFIEIKFKATQDVKIIINLVCICI